MTRLNQSKELIRRVQEFLLQRGGIEMKSSFLDTRLLLLYMRVVSLYKGVVVLLEARLAAEALILIREMLIDSLHLMELASREASSREALILYELNETLTQWQNLEKKKRSMREGAEKDARLLDYVQSQKKEIENYRRLNRVGKLKYGSVKQLLEEHGRTDEYVDFEFVQAVVHRPFIAQLGREERDSQLHRIHLHDPDDRNLVNAGALAMTSALHARKAISSIFGWTDTPPEQIDSLLAKIKVLPAEAPDES